MYASDETMVIVEGARVKPGPIPIHPLVRLKAQTVKSGKCWLHQARLDKDGYARLWDGYKYVATHRYVYQLVNKKKLPKERMVLHKCDVPNCWRPSHLFEGTHIDNMRDMVSKNRQAMGEENGMAKLTKQNVLLIRELVKIVPKRELARRFNVSDTLIRYISKGQVWKDIAKSP